MSAEAPQLDPAEIRPVGEQDTELHALFERYARPLERFCLRELGNREEAEDAVQTTFLNAFRAFRRGVRPELEAAWLYAIAANVCRSRRRSFFRRRRLEVDDDLHALEDVIAAPQALETEMLIGLGDALASMPESQRTAILLREWQGLSYAEIAREMNLTNGAVETLIFRARRTLAKGLEEEPSRRKKVVGGLNVGSLLSALKGLLGGAGAAKLAAAGTVAVIATLAAQPLVHHVTRAPDPAAPASIPPAPPRTTGRGAEVTRNMTPPASALRTGPTRTQTIVPAPRPAPGHSTQGATPAAHGGGPAASSVTSSGVAPAVADVGSIVATPPGQLKKAAGGQPGNAGSGGKGDKGGKSSGASNGNAQAAHAGQTQTPPGQAKKQTAPAQGKSPAAPGQEKKTDGGSGAALPDTSNKGGNGKGDGNPATETTTTPTDTTPSTDTPPADGNGNNGNATNAGNNGNGNSGTGSSGNGNGNANGHGKP